MTDKEFDLRMKSLLGDAEIPAPDGAWEAVRARIPAVKPAKKAAPWWWACAGLAAAAAVALALVLGGTFRPASSVVATECGQVLAQNETVLPSSPAPTGDLIGEETAGQAGCDATKYVAGPDAAAPAKRTARTSTPALRVGKKDPQPVLSPKAEEDAAPEAASAVADTPAEPAPANMQGLESASTKSSSHASGSSASDKKQSERWSDPFARMAYEDAHAKTRRPVSVDIRGLVGTNDKATAGARGGAMAAPSKTGTGSASTFINEDGESRYGVPISFGLGLKCYFADRWAVGTGINYSLLTRSFPGAYTKDDVSVPLVDNSNIKHNVQYVGIPVNLYFDAVSTPTMKLYGFAGGSLEKGIGQKYIIPVKDGIQYWKKTVPGLQGSAALGLGVQFNVTDQVGVYVDPSARYYFGEDQPKSIRTQQKVMFNLELGVRFDL